MGEPAEQSANDGVTWQSINKFSFPNNCPHVIIHDRAASGGFVFKKAIIERGWLS
jgi:hypothetical protein